MNTTDQDPLDWLRANCTAYVQPDGLVTDQWVWPSGLVHTGESSVAIVRMHQAMDLEPTDLITGQLMHTVVERLLALEQRVRKLGDLHLVNRARPSGGA